MTQPLRIIFAGTPDFAAQHLQALLQSKHQVIAVYSQPDRPAGRGQKLQASPVAQLALQHNIPLYQPKSLKKATAQAELSALQADVMVVVAYGLLLPQAVLNSPRLGCINVHGSLLPRWRGAAPIQRAIWAGDAQTGITIMQMDAGLDTGAMLSKVACPIQPADTSTTLYQKLAEMGPPALLQALNNLSTLQQQATPQDNNLATYAEKLFKEEARLDFSKSAEQLEREIRAFIPWPVSYLALAEGNIKVWQATAEPEQSAAIAGTVLNADKHGIRIACGSGSLLISNLQPAGKSAMTAADFLNGRANWLAVGKLLDSHHG